MPFTIATFNANSIRSRLPVVLQWLATARPDVLAMQETKVVDELFPRAPFEAAGWHVVCRGQKGYNGVAFVSRRPLQDVNAAWDPSGSGEARVITARWDDWFLVNTYVPQGYEIDSPKFQNKLKFFAGLKQLLSSAVTPKTPALWMGDLNVAPMPIDLHAPERHGDHVCFHPRARQALADAMGDVWIDLFREVEKGPGHYTYWDYMIPSNFPKNRGWRIDLMLGTAAAARRLDRVWIDRALRGWDKPSDHTVLAARFNAPGEAMGKE